MPEPPPTTSGREALREAARRESALVYGRTHHEHTAPHTERTATQEAASLQDRVEALIARGAPTKQIMTQLDVPYRTVRSARAAMDAIA